MIKEDQKLRVGITCGDLNGIGYEVILKALNDNRLLQMFTPIIYGSASTLSYHRKALRMNDFQFQPTESAKKLNRKKANVVNVWTDDVELEFGKSSSAVGAKAMQSIEMGASDLASGLIDVLVTAPINKKNIQEAGFQFPGHTEFLQSYAHAKDSLMLMVSDNLRVAVATNHVPLNEITKVLTADLIVSKLKLFNESLERDFLIKKPKIAVLGLNPHAGEGGTIGEEEQKVIAPALKAAREEGLFVHGPFPADGFFGSELLGKYDGVLAMYHDQGLTPFKALSFGSGVNYTAGLPIVRTSPDHGTAFEIAGKNEASGMSMRAAIYLACEIYNNRNIYKEMHANPLKVRKSEKKQMNA